MNVLQVVAVGNVYVRGTANSHRPEGIWSLSKHERPCLASVENPQEIDDNVSDVEQLVTACERVITFILPACEECVRKFQRI